MFTNHQILVVRTLFTVLVISFMGLGTISYADDASGDEPGQHHKHHRPGMGMPYLSASQLTSLAGLNLAEENWHSFWKGVHGCQKDAVKKGKKEDHQAFFAAFKASFNVCFTEQLAKAAPAK